MLKTYSTILTAAVSLAVAVAAVGGAEARSGGMSKSGPSIKSGPIKLGPIKSGPIIVGKPMEKHRHDYRSYGYVTPVIYASYSRCGWLKERALETGSPRWWARYEACRDDS